MPIQVSCPSCLTRFTVADQHAGKEGPCPKCKKKITIPNLEDEVVIHAPTPEGPTDSKGKSVLKTVKKKDATFDPLITTGVVVVVLSTLVAAFFLRGTDVANSWPILAGGSILLGPLIAWAGYSFLRDQELAPYLGFHLWGRATICGLLYALAWGVYFLLAWQLAGEGWQEAGLPIWQVGFAGAVAIGIGTFVGFVSLDLEPVMAGLQCGFYFIVTVLLRFVMDLPPLPGLLGDG